MGQAASYAESSVQRALLRLKQEEQTEEEELLCACGYGKPSASPAQRGNTPPPHEEGDDRPNMPAGATAAERPSPASSPLPTPPESFGPLVSLAPEYYSLDELRDALRYLPDTLWVSLHRVSLLYILDNDHDGRVRSTDISFFMDWGIKTVGRDVPPEQLAEVLQTYAALHCWHRCLHVGQEIEIERAASAAQQSGRGGAGGGGISSISSTGPRARRRPLQSAGLMGGVCSGSSPSPHHHHQQQQPPSVSSFMLLHLREAFFRQPRGPTQSPSTSSAGTPAAAAAAAAVGGGATSPDGGLASSIAPHFFSPRSASAQPVTATTRLEAAAHFAEWMVRLVRNQERDRRSERQRFERRLRCLTSSSEMRLGGSRLRHSQLLQHHTMRLRGGSLAVFPSSGDCADAEDVATSQSGMPMRTGVDVSDETEPEMVAMLAPRLSLPDNDTVSGLPWSASTTTSTATMTHSAATAPAKMISSPSSRSVTPLGSTQALPKAPRDAPTSEAATVTHGTKSGPLLSDSPPQQSRRPQQQRVPSSSRGQAAPSSAFTVSSSLRPLPSFPYPLTTAPSEDNVLMRSNPTREGGRWGSSSADGQATSLPWGSQVAAGAASVSPWQLAAVLMDSDAFYTELERNGWCTIGAVEEAYLDFAVEDSYCLSFWAFCRLLNESSAAEVQAALDLTTAQATAVLTSAAAVEEYRRTAALRQLQRLHAAPQRTASQFGGWEAQVEVVPVFIVSEYTFVTFVTAFIHAYWDMLESMGIEAVTQPAELASLMTARSTSAALRTA